jgi:hypothetical protein
VKRKVRAAYGLAGEGWFSDFEILSKEAATNVRSRHIIVASAIGDSVEIACR